MTQTPETPNARMDRLELALGRFAELTIQNIQRHDEVLQRLETQVEAMSMTVTDLARTAANQAVRAEQDRVRHQNEIAEIWRYLRYEPRNGNGRGGEQ